MSETNTLIALRYPPFAISFEYLNRLPEPILSAVYDKVIPARIRAISHYYTHASKVQGVLIKLAFFEFYEDPKPLQDIKAFISAALILYHTEEDVHEHQ